MEGLPNKIGFGRQRLTWLKGSLRVLSGTLIARGDSACAGKMTGKMAKRCADSVVGNVALTNDKQRATESFREDITPKV
jgi:hypothetical protein